MENKFRIIAEYKSVAPFVGMTHFNTIGECIEHIKQSNYGPATKVWAVSIAILSDGTICPGYDDDHLLLINERV